LASRDKVAVLVEGSLGDSLILIPTIRLIARHYGEAGVHLVCLAPAGALNAGQVLRDTFPTSHFIHAPVSPDAGARARAVSWIGIARALKARGIVDVIYALRPERAGSRTRALAHYCVLRAFGSFRLLGFAVRHVPNAREAAANPRGNRIARLLFDRTARALRDDSRFEAADSSLRLTHRHREFATRWLARHGDAGRGHVAACVTAKTEAQRWPVENYVRVLEGLLERHAIAPILLGAESDRPLHEQIIHRLGAGASAAGNAVLDNAALLEHCRFYLGNDTGAMHLAAALGIRCVAVFSARNLRGSWNPLGEGHVVHEAPVPCSGCGLSRCRLDVQICFAEIRWEDVLASCEQQLGPGT